MGEDHKNEPQKMISSTTDQKDDVAMNEVSDAKMEEDHKNKAAGKMISSTTDHQKEGGDDDVTMNEGGTSSDSSTLPSKKRKVPETTPAETSSKKRSGGRFIFNLDVGQNVVDAIFELSKAYPHQSVIINSVTGPVSDVVLVDQTSTDMREGEFQILFLSVKCLIGDDGRHCRKKAACSILLTDVEGILLGFANVNSLLAAGPVEIIASTFTTDVAKESGARILADAAARNGNSDSEKIIEVGQSSRLSPTSRLLPPTPPAADGKINPTTTSAANDQDMKSPSDT